MGTRRRTPAVLVGLLALASRGAFLDATLGAQATGVLHVRVALTDETGQSTPIRRHALLISDNPASRAPRRVVTGPDGTARVTLPPANYTVESEVALVAGGRAFEWREVVDIEAGRDTVLDLTTANAEVVTAAASSTEPDAPREHDAWGLLLQWQDSLVQVWTPTRHGSGVVVSDDGLIATSQRVVADRLEVEVQVTSALKVAGRVVAADVNRDVALVWVHPSVVGARPALPVGCGGIGTRGVTTGQAIVAIGQPMRGQSYPSKGTVRRTQPGALTVELDVPVGSVGGPAFAADGTLVGLTTVAAAGTSGGEADTQVVRVEALCDVLPGAVAAIARGTPPPATPLPVEPGPPVADDLLRETAKRRAGSLAPYAASSATFDVGLITPVSAFAGLEGSMDFGQWTDYVAGRLPVLLVRVTPKQVERLWLKVARGVAMTQGIALPPITQFAPGVADVRIRCGSADVPPIHPFLIERRTSETAAVREGLLVLAPEAIGPHCGTVSIEVTSEKNPGRKEIATVDARILRQVWDDLAPWRAPDPPR